MDTMDTTGTEFPDTPDTEFPGTPDTESDERVLLAI